MITPNKVVDKYILQNILGSGQFGDVYKAQMMDTNKYYAVKTVSLEKIDTETFRSHLLIGMAWT